MQYSSSRCTAKNISHICALAWVESYTNRSINFRLVALDTSGNQVVSYKNHQINFRLVADHTGENHDCLTRLHVTCLFSLSVPTKTNHVTARWSDDSLSKPNL